MTQFDSRNFIHLHFKVKQGALELLGERLPHVSEKVRAEAVPIINTILLLLKQIISSLSPGSLSVSALKALKSITITLRPGEENSLTDMIPLVLATTEVSELSAAAFSALVPMPCVIIIISLASN